MKEKRKKGKVKIKKFDFQKFMVEYNITKEILDEKLVDMIEIFENHIDETVKNCRGSVCLEITSQFQDFADFIMNEVWEHVQEHGLPEVLVQDDLIEEEEVQEEANLLKEQLKFFEVNYDDGKRKIGADMLAEVGIEAELLNKRLFEIGHFIFSRRLMSSEWTIYRKSAVNEPKKDEKEED